VTLLFSFLTIPIALSLNLKLSITFTPREVNRVSVSKSQYALKANIQKMIDDYGLNRIGFLTLTFPLGPDGSPVDTVQEANRRLNSLMSNYLSAKLTAYILIRERQRSGAWHFHLLAVLPYDIRTGGQFVKKAKGGYSFKTTNVKLINFWRELREALPRYGFGRHELLPVRKDSQAVSTYLSKYLGKHHEARNAAKAEGVTRDKHVRLVSYSRSFVRAVSTCFSWHNSFCTKLRKKVAAIALHKGITTPEQFYESEGPSWGFKVYSYAAHLVEVVNAAAFNLACYMLIPWAPLVALVDGQIVSVETGEVYF
jgi:hypothetical protein